MLENTPGNKSQAPNWKQIPSTKSQVTNSNRHLIVIWCLDIVICLYFGAGLLEFASNPGIEFLGAKFFEFGGLSHEVLAYVRA